MEADYITELMGKRVYTTAGKYVGIVHDVQVDANQRKISGLALKHVNKARIDLPAIIIPYRWVQYVSDAILINDAAFDNKCGK